MTTGLTPFRLFQVCKYAFQKFTADKFNTRKGKESLQRYAALTRSSRIAKLGREEGHPLLKSSAAGLEERASGGGGPGEGRYDWASSSSSASFGSGSTVGEGSSTGNTVREREGQSTSSRNGGDDGNPLTRPQPSPSSSSGPSSNSSTSSSPNPTTPEPSEPPTYPTEIARLMADPTLFTPQFKPPRNIIVLCHGLSLPLFSLPYLFLSPPATEKDVKEGSEGSPSSLSLLTESELKKTQYSHQPPSSSSSSPSHSYIRSLLSHPGLYGFSTATPIPLFPSLKLHYWAAVLEVLRDKLGAKVIVVGVKGTGSIEERAKMIHEYLEANVPEGTGLNFMAHSMGGLDCRYLISHLKPQKYKPLSLTMIGTPNRGSPFMDWCAANIGVGSTRAAAKAAAEVAAASKKAASKLPPYSLKSPLLSLPPTPEKSEKSDKASESDSSILGIPSFFGSSITSYLLGLLDSPAYGNLTTHFLNEEFNPNTPDDPSVKYTSVAGRINKMSVLHPLWFPKLVLDAAAQTGYAEEEGQSGKGYEGNDGLVSVSSAKWGEWLGTVDGCHHWDLRGEGGLFPAGGSTATKPEGRPDKNHPDGWDWGHKSNNKDLSLEEQEELKKSAGEELKKKSEELKKATGSDSSWDMAQVRQVVDWVADLIPGTGDDKDVVDKEKVGARHIADAMKEKAREEGRKVERKEVGEEKEAAFSNLHQTGQTGHREKGKDEKRLEKMKFDLGRFYGGLLVKIREDGF